MSVRVPLDPEEVRRRARRDARAQQGRSRARGSSTKLLYLVKVRVSQINGCGFCLDMHTKDARLDGETEQRLYLLNAWREAPMYSERERAALAWAEAVTSLENGEVPDECMRRRASTSTSSELVKLTLQIVAINGWNRFCISFNATPGTYKAGSLRKSGVAPSLPSEAGDPTRSMDPARLTR